MHTFKFSGFIPRRYEIIVFSFFLSMFMSLLVSGVSTLRVTGLSPVFFATWLPNWLSSWLFAFPAVILVAPFVRRLVRLLLRDETSTS